MGCPQTTTCAWLSTLSLGRWYPNPFLNWKVGFKVSMPMTHFNTLHSHSQSLTESTLCFVSIVFLVLQLGADA